MHPTGAARVDSTLEGPIELALPADTRLLRLVRLVASGLASTAGCCVWPRSSPASSIGTPCDSSSVASRLRIWRARSASTAGSELGPSTPQFHDRLWLLPSRLSSPLASLCFSL
jgi:hypothetical protein